MILINYKVYYCIYYYMLHLKSRKIISLSISFHAHLNIFLICTFYHHKEYNLLYTYYQKFQADYHKD